MQTALILLGLLGILALAGRVVRCGFGGLAPEQAVAVAIVLALYALFAVGALLGALGLLTPLACGICGVIGLGAGCAGLLPWLAGRIRSLAALPPLGAAFPLVACCLPPILLCLPASIGSTDLYYHLASIEYIVRSGSATTFDPAWLVLPASEPTHYYMRGQELLLSPVFFSACPKLGVVAFKAGLLALLVAGLLMVMGRSRLSWAVCAALCANSVILTDINSLKNDLGLTALVIFIYATMLQPNRVQLAPVAAMACALALAIKANGLLFVAPAVAILLWQACRLPARRWCWIPLLAVGAFFYVVNGVRMGNPFYPMPVTVGPWTIFRGTSESLLRTTVMANMDGRLVPMLLRGMLRSFSVLHVALWALAGAAWIWIARRRRAPAPAGGARFWPVLLVGYLALCYVATPLSDNNGITHNLLFSGHTMRMLAPALFLFSALTIRSVQWVPRVRLGVYAAVLLAAAAGLCQQDLLACAFKPQLAFASYASVFMTDQTWLLMAGTFTVFAALWVLLRTRRWVWVALAAVVCSASLSVARPPAKFLFSEAYRILGQSDPGAWAVLRQQARARPALFILADAPGNPLASALMEFACQSCTKVTVGGAADALTAGSDVVVQCATVQEAPRRDWLRGRQYQATFAPTPDLPERYVMLYASRWYRISALAGSGLHPMVASR